MPETTEKRVLQLTLDERGVSDIVGAMAVVKSLLMSPGALQAAIAAMPRRAECTELLSSLLLMVAPEGIGPDDTVRDALPLLTTANAQAYVRRTYATLNAMVTWLYPDVAPE